LCEDALRPSQRVDGRRPPLHEKTISSWERGEFFARRKENSRPLLNWPNLGAANLWGWRIIGDSSGGGIQPMAPELVPLEKGARIEKRCYNSKTK